MLFFACSVPFFARPMQAGTRFPHPFSLENPVFDPADAVSTFFRTRRNAFGQIRTLS
jgi:hypothetical protein